MVQHSGRSADGALRNLSGLTSFLSGSSQSWERLKANFDRILDGWDEGNQSVHLLLLVSQSHRFFCFCFFFYWKRWYSQFQLNEANGFPPELTLDLHPSWTAQERPRVVPLLHSSYAGAQHLQPKVQHLFTRGARRCQRSVCRGRRWIWKSINEMNSEEAASMKSCSIDQLESNLSLNYLQIAKDGVRVGITINNPPYKLNLLDFNASMHCVHASMCSVQMCVSLILTWGRRRLKIWTWCPSEHVPSHGSCLPTALPTKNQQRALICLSRNRCHMAGLLWGSPTLYSSSSGVSTFPSSSNLENHRERSMTMLRTSGSAQL